MNLAKILPKSTTHPAIFASKENAYRKLVLPCEAMLVDGDAPLFKNNGDTLVLALVDCSDSSAKNNAQIHEWVNGYTNLLMEAVAELKPDEFEIQPLSGLPGYNRIVRMWWD